MSWLGFFVISARRVLQAQLLVQEALRSKPNNNFQTHLTSISILCKRLRNRLLNRRDSRVAPKLIPKNYI